MGACVGFVVLLLVVALYLSRKWYSTPPATTTTLFGGVCVPLCESTNSSATQNLGKITLTSSRLTLIYSHVPFFSFDEYSQELSISRPGDKLWIRGRRPEATQQPKPSAPRLADHSGRRWTVKHSGLVYFPYISFICFWMISIIWNVILFWLYKLL